MSISFSLHCTIFAIPTTEVIFISHQHTLMAHLAPTSPLGHLAPELHADRLDTAGFSNKKRQLNKPPLLVAVLSSIENAYATVINPTTTSLFTTWHVTDYCSARRFDDSTPLVYSPLTLSERIHSAFWCLTLPWRLSRSRSRCTNHLSLIVTCYKVLFAVISISQLTRLPRPPLFFTKGWTRAVRTCYSNTYETPQTLACRKFGAGDRRGRMA